MFADLIGMDGFWIDVEIAGDAGAEAGGVEDGAGADDFLSGEAGEFVSIVSKYVHRIGDNKEKPIKTGSHDLLDHALKNVDVFGKELHAGLAGFLGGAGSDDDDIAIVSVFVGAIADFDVAGGDSESVTKIHSFTFGIFGNNVG